MTIIPLHQLMVAAMQLHANVLRSGATVRTLYGIPRGGVSAALLMAAANPRLYIVTEDITRADMVIDDLFDSGQTANRYKSKSPTGLVGTLLTKRPALSDRMGVLFGAPVAQNEWVSFPWELLGERDDSGRDIVTRLLQFIGEDAGRGGLIETPERFLKAWNEWTAGYGINPAAVLKTFEDGADHYDELILVKDIPVYSKCEHHLADIFGVAHVGYIPNGKIVGLSKLSRLVDVFARRLQVQERLTVQIADALVDNLAPKGVAVVLECRHACMESRGINKAGTTTITSAMRGVMLTKPEARSELMSMIRGGSRV